MSQIEILPAQSSPIDFDISRSSPAYRRAFNQRLGNDPSAPSFNDTGGNWSPTTAALVNEIISSSPLRITADSPLRHHTVDSDPAAIFPNLPPLHHGHPDLHLRNGIMNAFQLAADNEPDAEKAFFVADLSQVYRQHLRWHACLPEIQPFYGQHARV